MPDWVEYVRLHLADFPLDGPFSAEIAQELADHLETAYQEALDSGSTLEGAEEIACRLVDWRLLENEFERFQLGFSTPGVRGQKPGKKSSLAFPSRASLRESQCESMVAGERVKPMAFIGNFIRELRQSGRRLLESPVFSGAAILTLALGIGATSAVFSILETVILKPLPYPDSDRLVWLWHSAPGANIDEIGVSYGTYLHYRDRSKSLEDLAIFHRLEVTVKDRGNATRVPVAIVSPNFFDLLLNEAPPLGRLFNADDGKAGAPRVILLSYPYWVRQFGRDPGVLGRSLEVSGTIGEIVGVLPPSFDFPTPDTDLWYPIRLDPTQVRLGQFNASGIARLAPGVTLGAARSELADLVQRLDERFPGNSYEAIVRRGRLTAQIEPLKSHLVGPMLERTLWAIFFGVALLLLIACANLTNLMLARMQGRRRELAIRTALGANGRELAGIFLGEPLLLAATGGALGLLLALGGLEVMVRLGLDWRLLPRWNEFGIDPALLAFSAGITIAVMLAVGLIPLVLNRAERLVWLNEESRGSTGGRETRRWHDLLVVGQLSIAVILLVCAGLMIRSFWKLEGLDPGFKAAGTLTFQVILSGQDFPDRKVAAGFQQALIDRISALPGVQAVGAGDCLPLDCPSNVNPLLREDQTVADGEIPPAVQLRTVAPGFFRAAQIPLLRGRELARSDHEQLTGAVVVNRTLAESFWPNENPIGKRVFPSLVANPAWYHIVGVVADTPRETLTEDAYPTAYFPMIWKDSQMVPGPNFLYYIVRTGLPPIELEPSIRALVHSLDPAVPVTRFRTLTALVSRATATQRLATTLLAIAAGVAVLLGCVGIYGVFSYAVNQRRGEIGVRMALGAGSREVQRLILSRGVRITCLGLGIGLIVSFGLSQFLETLLFEIQPTDVITYGVVSSLLFGCAVAACYLPARRASRIDAVRALHES